MNSLSEHYQKMGLQPWDVTAAWLSPEQYMGFLLGNVIKYVARFNTHGTAGKGGLNDLEKAKHYLERAIALEEQP
jgi:hypothetical protein